MATRPATTSYSRRPCSCVPLLFRHTLTPLDGGGTRVTHQLEISGPGADKVGPELGPQIGGDFPVTMTELLTAARARYASPLST